ncbi:MAG: hypothetical protein WKG01_36455 [Kofleriaceae bacterium]
MRALPLLLLGACSFSPPSVAEDGGLTGEAGADAKVFLDARVHDASASCFGQDPYLVCLPAMSAAALTFGAETIDTDAGQCKSASHTGVIIDLMNGGPQLCVFAGTTIDLNGRLRAEGALPLVVLASGNLNVNQTGYVDVSSYRGDPDPGAAANDTVCTATDGEGDPGGGGGGGGAGGSFGGAGGAGASSASGQDGGTTTVPAAPVFLRGGCAGTDGGGSGNGAGEGAASGGAVYLLAGGDLRISGKIDASGEGGEGGPAKGGGGGGGSGGMIVLYAGANLVVEAGGRVWANGGGGGGGGASNSEEMTASNRSSRAMQQPVAHPVPVVQAPVEPPRRRSACSSPARAAAAAAVVRA